MPLEPFEGKPDFGLARQSSFGRIALTNTDLSGDPNLRLQLPKPSGLQDSFCMEH